MPSMGVSAKMHINIYQIIGIVFLLAVSYTVLLQGQSSCLCSGLFLS